MSKKVVLYFDKFVFLLFLNKGFVLFNFNLVENIPVKGILLHI